MAVFLARALLPAHAEASGIQVVPPDQRMTPALAAKLLASLDKPLSCRADVLNGIPRITCAPGTEDTPVDGLTVFFSPEEVAVMRRALGRKILILGNHERLVVPPAVVDRFASEYVFDGTYAWTTRPPRLLERLRGISMVLRLFHLARHA